jgi:hypothetical protein
LRVSIRAKFPTLSHRVPKRVMPNGKHVADVPRPAVAPVVAAVDGVAVAPHHVAAQVHLHAVALPQPAPQAAGKAAAMRAAVDELGKDGARSTRQACRRHCA